MMSRKIILIKQELLLLVYELNRSGLLAENEKIRPILAQLIRLLLCFFFQAEDGIRDGTVTGVQTCALPISPPLPSSPRLCRSRSTRPALSFRLGPWLPARCRGPAPRRMRPSRSP